MLLSIIQSLGSNKENQNPNAPKGKPLSLIGSIAGHTELTLITILINALDNARGTK